MKLVVFGLGVSSSWGNGHATLWRGLIGALGRLGHEVFFFEKDVPYYARTRDLDSLPSGTLVLYRTLAEVLPVARELLRSADCAMITSYCPDARAVAPVLLGEARGLRVFYDLDTPITLERDGAGDRVEYIPEEGLSEFDLVLSYTGGLALEGLRRQLGARRVATLHGSADPAVHFRTAADARFTADLSYLGTYAEDRQAQVEALFLQPARRAPGSSGLIAGPMYPDQVNWPENVRHLPHLPPSDHPAFYSSGRLALSVTRKAMALLGHCPSARYFEAALCGTPVLTDSWPGLERFYEPDREILVADSTEDVLAALCRPAEELARIGEAARRRTLAEHTADVRARELVGLIRAGSRATGPLEARS